MKHIIIGGVAGGAPAAARIRRADEKAEILLVEKGKYISYANCGLPYYIGGVIADREKLFVQTPASFGKRFNVDVRITSEAVAIDTEAKTVTLLNNDGSKTTETYDRLLLSPGATPVVPPLKGIDNEGIMTLRTPEDTDRIKAYMGSRNVKRAVVVGGGFIGLEMAENLRNAGCSVAIVEMAPQVMAPVDFSIASFVHRELTDKGVELPLSTGVEGFEKAGETLKVMLSNGKTIDTDMVLLSIGVRPNTKLATEAGIELGERGIKVNEYLQTSAENVYAVGDAIEYPHPVSGKAWMNYLAGPANRHGLRQQKEIRRCDRNIDSKGVRPYRRGYGNACKTTETTGHGLLQFHYFQPVERRLLSRSVHDDTENHFQQVNRTTLRSTMRRHKGR